MGKSVDIFMTFYIGDYLKKTTMLSCEEHGAYILLLFSLWQSGGYLPNDSKKLARICRVSCKKWEKIFSNISCFFICEENQISNKRVLEEIEQADLRRVRAGQNGAKGGRPTKEKPSGLPSGLPSGVPTDEPKQNPEKSSSPSPSPSPSPSYTQVHIPNDTVKENIKRKTRTVNKFAPPTLEEVKQYCKEHKYKFFDCERYLNLRNSNNWVKSNGKKVLDWKNDVNTNQSFGNHQRQMTAEEKFYADCDAFADEQSKKVY